MSTNAMEKLVLLLGHFDLQTLKRLKDKGESRVYIMEGRPKLESTQEMVTALLSMGIKPVLIADNMAGFLFARALVREVWLSYQMVDQKGAVCRIGGLILAVLGKKHKVPVTLFRSGQRIKFMGKPQDLFHFLGERVAPVGIKAYVPQVEWVPGKYISKRHE